MKYCLELVKMILKAKRGKIDTPFFLVRAKETVRKMGRLVI